VWGVKRRKGMQWNELDVFRASGAACRPACYCYLHCTEGASATTVKMEIQDCFLENVFCALKDNAVT